MISSFKMTKLLEVNVILWQNEKAMIPITNNVVVPAMIDSGSELNIIKSNMLVNQMDVNTNDKIKMKGINDTTSWTKGSIWCNLEFNDNSPIISSRSTSEEDNPLFKIKFQVKDDSPVGVIIGMPFIQTFVSSLDFNVGRMNVLMPKKNKRNRRRLASIPMWTKISNPKYSFIAKENNEQFIIDQKCLQFKALEGNKVAETKDDQPGYCKIPINPKLSMAEQERFRSLLESCSSLFDISTNEVSVFKHGDHCPLKLPLSSSVYSLPKRYDIPSALVPEFGKQVKSWVEGGVVVPQKKNVQYRNNIVCVKKADGSWRFCLDASMLNTIIAKENQVIPKIDQLLHDVSGHSYYTTLDLSQFFLNFKLDEESSDLTTFYSPVDNLLYKFIRSPFGIRWSMSYAIRLCNEELSKIPNGHTFFRAYVDDILVFSSSLDDHFNHLKLVLEQLKVCNFKIKPKKMKVAYHSADIFGYQIDKDGFTISTARKEKLLSLKRPTSKKELQQLIGKLGYFRMVMGKEYPMAAIQAGFSDLVSGNKRFLWTSKHDETWDLIRKALFNTVKLNKLNADDYNVTLRSDASITHFGASLTTTRNGKEVIIHCMSRVWTKRFIEAHITQKELMAILIAVDILMFDLVGRMVDIQTDNAYAAYVLRHPHKTFYYQKSNLVNALDNLKRINYKVTKTSNQDSKFRLCDLLSRADGPKVLLQPNSVKELLTIMPPLEPDEIHTSYLATEMALANRLDSSKQIHYPSSKDISGLSNLAAMRRLMQIIPEINDYMNKYDLIEVPATIRSQLVTLIHNVCHFGNTRVISLLLQFKYRWRGMNRQVSNIVRNCRICQRFKPSNKKLQLTTTSNQTLTSGEEIAIDLKEIKGHHPVTILVAIDVASHYIEAARVSGRLDSENIAKALLMVLSRLAPTCKRMRMDNDPKLKSRFFQEFLTTLGIKPIYGARLSSRSNSLIERSIGLLANQISYLNMDNLPATSWDVGISMATLFVNLSPRQTMGNLTPYELRFGKTIIFDEEEVKQTRCINLTRFSKQLRERIESLQMLKRILPKEEYPRMGVSLYKVNDLVRIAIPRPKHMARTLAPKWSSSIYRILSVKPQFMTYQVQNIDNDDDIRISHNRQTKRISNDDDNQPENLSHISRLSNLNTCKDLVQDIRKKLMDQPEQEKNERNLNHENQLDPENSINETINQQSVTRDTLRVNENDIESNESVIDESSTASKGKEDQNHISFRQQENLSKATPKRLTINNQNSMDKMSKQNRYQTRQHSQRIKLEHENKSRNNKDASRKFVKRYNLRRRYRR